MVFLASKTCYWEQSWRLLRNRLWNMIWGVDHSTLQTKSSSFFIIRGNPVLTTGSSSLRPVLWKWHEQKFMCRNNISKLTLFKKVLLITPKLQVLLITPPDAIYKTKRGRALEILSMERAVNFTWDNIVNNTKYSYQKLL